jgi:hypothetical protein
MSPIMVTLRCCVIIVIYIVIHVSWIEGDLPLNMSHRKGDDQKERARYQVNCCQGGDCWDLVATNSFKDGFGSYYSKWVTTK